MAKLARRNGTLSNILRVKILDSTSAAGAGLTGLTSASSGLKISTIANNEATATVYTVAGSTIETITTLGTFAAPTATKCRFKEVDATNHPGLYEIQIADARFAVANAKALIVSLLGATNMVSVDLELDLQLEVGSTGINRASFAPDTGLQTVRSGTAQAGAASTITFDAGASATNNFYDGTVYLTGGTGVGQFRNISSYVGSTKVATVDVAWTVQPDNTTTFAIFPGSASDLTVAAIRAEIDAALDSIVPDSVPADGTRPSMRQAAYMGTQFLLERSVSGTVMTVYKPDGTTPLFTLALNSAVAPTVITRAT